MELKIIRKHEAVKLERQAAIDLKHIEGLIAENTNAAGDFINPSIVKRLEGDRKRMKRQQARFYRIANT